MDPRYLGDDNEELGAVDYVVFVLLLLSSLAVGAYYAWKDRNKQSNAEFLMGGSDLTPFPVATSLMASFVSSVVILGFPTQVYALGTGLVWTVVTVLFASTLAAEVFVPIFHRLKLTSVNLYLSQRFESDILRMLSSISVLVFTMFYLGIVLYGPALALGSVTGMSSTTTIMLMGSLCSIYTTLGGLKAVVWTDVIQYSFMLVGLLAIVIKGTIDAGGVFEVFRLAKLGGRMNAFDFEVDMHSSTSFWSVFVGTMTIWTGYYASSQMQVQRTCSMPTLKKAKSVIYMAVPGLHILMLTVIYIGLLAFANYSRCDPLRSGKISKADELIPHFVTQSLGDDYPGIPGLFVASVFGASLSSLSSGYNALAAVVWDDFLRPKMPGITDKKAVMITRGLAMLMGIFSIGGAFLCREIGTIFDASYLLQGASVGPLFALFLSGMFFVQSNAAGAITGLIVGQIACVWVTIGSIVVDKPVWPPLILPASTELCTDKNLVVFGTPFEALHDAKVPEYYPEGLARIYHISPFYVPMLGFIATLVVTLVVSVATGGNKGKEIDPRLMAGFVNHLRGIDKSRYKDRTSDDEDEDLIEMKATKVHVRLASAEDSSELRVTFIDADNATIKTD